MRALILLAGAALALSACGKKDNAGTNQDTAGGLTADKIVANDVTAIDAVTGDAANMAADVNYEGIDNSLDAVDNGAAPAPSKPRSASKPASKKSETAASAGTNTTAAAATTNSQ